MKRDTILILAAILFLAIFLRFFALGAVPNGLYQDETAIGYNAYSILTTGKDEHGQSYPLYFKSFGDWKLPVYIYSAVPAVALFGMTPFAVRLPSAVFGVLSVAAMYFFTRRLTKNNNVSLLSAFILAVTPWHLHYSRATFEVSICLFLYLSGGYFLLRSAQEKVFKFFVLGTVLFVINLYTYNLTRLLTPALYILFVYYGRTYFMNTSRLQKYSLGLVLGLGALPLFAGVFGQGGVSSASGTLIHTSASVQAKILEFRSFLIELPPGLVKIFFNKWLMTLWVYIENIFSYISAQFFFISGSSHGNHGIGNFGQFYMFMLPLLVLGLWKGVAQKRRYIYFLLAFAIITVLVAALTRETTHATRSFFLLIPLTIFIAEGANFLYTWIKGLKKIYRYTLGSIFSILVLFNVAYYLTSYYVVFPVEYAAAWRSEDGRLSDFIRDNAGGYDKVVFDSSVGNVYTALLFYGEYSPLEFQRTARFAPDDSEGFSRITSFGDYEFKTIDFENINKAENILYITTSKNPPKNLSVIEVIKFPVRPVVSALGQEIVTYPVEDVAYVIAKSE